MTALIKHFTNVENLIKELLAAGTKLEKKSGVITTLETPSEDNLTLTFVRPEINKLN